MCPRVYVSLALSFSLSVYVCVCLFMYMSVYVHIYMYVCVFVRRVSHRFVPFENIGGRRGVFVTGWRPCWIFGAFLCLSVCLSVCLFVCFV